MLFLVLQDSSDIALDSMSETDAGLFRRMFTNGLFELMGTDRAFEFGLKLILYGIERVIKEQER